MQLLKTVEIVVYTNRKIVDLKDAIIKIKDGGANEITVTVGAGNLTYTEKKENEYVTDRGSLDLVCEGDEQPMDVKMDFQWTQITNSSGGSATIEDALKQQGGAAAWASTDSNACNPYAVDVEVAIVPGCGSLPTVTTTLPDFRHDQLYHDLQAGTVSCTGRCNAVEPTHVLS